MRGILLGRVQDAGFGAKSQYGTVLTITLISFRKDPAQGGKSE